MSSRFCAVSTTPANPVGDADLILPCQYYDVSGGHHLSGEQRLMLALLTDAINVYQRGALSPVTRARRLYVDAERWILADERGAGAGLSFSGVCDALGIHAGLLRRRLVEWKHTARRQRTEHPVHFKVTRRQRHNSHRRGRPPEHAFVAM